MILTKEAISDHINSSSPLITGYIDINLQLQPNGFDLSIYSISKFISKGKIDFDNKERHLSNLQKIDTNDLGWMSLSKGCYIVTYNEIINLPMNLMALGNPRSSLLRVGVSVETAVWDAGYKGRSSSLVIVNNPYGVEFSKNTRITQLIFFELPRFTEGYKGFYQEENLD